MKAAYYSTKGPARDVLIVCEQPDPVPQTGEVLVGIIHSGVNPSDVKFRLGVTSPTMEFHCVIPHSDGAGVIEAVGDGVRRSSRKEVRHFAKKFRKHSIVFEGARSTAQETLEIAYIG